MMFMGLANMKHLDFDMNLLKVLSILFEERSVTRTGDRLGLTQSAISNSLRKLREAMDDPLFVRGSNGLVLTTKARLLEEQVHEIVRSTDKCLAVSEEFDPQSVSGRCRLGAPDRLSLPLILPLLTTLGARAPNIALDVIPTDREQSLTMLDTGHLDIAIGWFANVPIRFTATMLFQEDFVCLCRQGHPILAIDEPIEISTILSYPHLVVSAVGDRKAIFDLMLARIGQQRDAKISVSNFSIVPNILRESDMIGVFTERVSNALAIEFNLATLPVPLGIEPLDHYMAWHNRNNADQQQKWIREQINLVSSSQSVE